MNCCDSFCYLYFYKAICVCNCKPQVSGYFGLVWDSVIKWSGGVWVSSCSLWAFDPPRLPERLTLPDRLPPLPASHLSSTPSDLLRLLSKLDSRADTLGKEVLFALAKPAVVWSWK